MEIKTDKSWKLILMINKYIMTKKITNAQQWYRKSVRIKRRRARTGVVSML
jgi:hypothetical protein